MDLDKKEKDFLKRITKGISGLFGENCEVVLHDFTQDFEHTIVAIENGHITGRVVGDSATNLGLELLRGTDQHTGDHINYVTKTPKGQIIRSSTIYMRDDDNKPIMSIGINYDITNLFSVQKELQQLVNMENTEQVTEYFNTNVDDLLDNLITESFRIVGKSIAQMNKDDKLTALKYLDQKGTFLIKKSGDKVSNFY